MKTKGFELKIKSAEIRRKLTAAALVFTAAFSVYAKISFKNPDLNDENKVVFTVEHNVPGTIPYSAAIMADVEKLSDVKILTCYPEKMELLSNGAILQVRNRYGNARYSFSDSTLSWISRADTIPLQSACQIEQSVSPDGAWLCYLKANSPAKASLILKNSSTFQEIVLDEKAVFSGEKVPVKWNSDSSVFIYEKGGNLYFCEPKAAFQKVQITEEFRKIGSGTINSVYWANPKTLIYIDGDIVYKIPVNELYTRSLYSPLVGIGRVSGRLPFLFECASDKFYSDQTAEKLAFVRGNKNAILFELKDNGFNYLTVLNSWYFTNLSGTVVDSELFWTPLGKIVLWLDIISTRDGMEKSVFVDFTKGAKVLAEFNESARPKLSPDRRKICFAHGSLLEVYDLENWLPAGRINGEKFISYIWANDKIIYAGGESTVRQWNTSSAEKSPQKVLFLSSSKKVFWKTDKSLCAEDSCRANVFYDYDFTKGTWQTSPSVLPDEKFTVPQPKVQNGRYRVFTGTTQNSDFENTLYVRTLSGGVVTKPVFPSTAVKNKAKKQISLIIDVIDSDAGLGKILWTLKKFNVPATFFVNGEFIRRYPAETKQIVLNGFDCASMFFTTVRADSKEFVMDEDFIRRGLARNEDEFFTATGSELSLFWHAPYYKSNDTIRRAGAAAGYKYIEAGRLSLDTITLEDASRGKAGYMSASELVEFLTENSRDGAIIPVCAGLSNGTRTDYLYEKLDLLIMALIDNGFEFVELGRL